MILMLGLISAEQVSIQVSDQVKKLLTDIEEGAFSAKELEMVEYDASDDDS